MAEMFTSFDEAWTSFLAREHPLESLFAELPNDPEWVVERWLIIPPPELKREALRVQGALELPDLRIVPHHFLHVSLGGAKALDLDELLALPPFELRVARLNCFPTAVVAEVQAEALDELEAPDTFLPHLSLAYVEAPASPRPVREAVVPRRDVELGTFVVPEFVRVRVPAAKTTLLQPWSVVERARLRR